MLIRKANPGEGPICDELLTQLIQMESRWDENMDETFTVCDNYEYRMTEDDTLLLVAEENGEIIGFLFGFLYPSPVHKKPLALLDALYVSEEHRCKGCGRALALRFKEWAKVQNVFAVELKVMSQNTTALRLYESLGFGEIKKYMQCKL